MDGDSLLLDQSCGVIPVCGLLLASLLLHVQTNLDLEIRSGSGPTAKPNCEKTQDCSATCDNSCGEGSSTDPRGGNKSDAGQTDQKSSENIREI